jgi:glycosyltransferase involved in cell wall biosynthesis
MKTTIVHLITSLKMGGAESLLYDLIAGLGSAKFEHHVIYFYDGPNVERIKSLGVPVYHITGCLNLYDPVFFWRLFACVKRLKPDLIHSALWSANFAGRLVARLLSMPLVSAVHLGVDLEGKIRNFFDYCTLRSHDRLIAVSEEVAKTIQQTFVHIPSHTIAVIRNGINPAHIVERVQRHERRPVDIGLSDEHIIIGSVGRFIKRKNYPLLLEAFADVYKRLPQVRLVLVGFGPEEVTLRNRAASLGISHAVIFVIGQPAYGYYALFDCFALTSHREGISIALLEAMSCKLPCIITTPTEHHEVISNGEQGFVIRSQDKVTLGQRLEQLVQDRYLRQRLGNAAYEILQQKFSMSVMVDSYRTIFLDAQKEV